MNFAPQIQNKQAPMAYLLNSFYHSICQPRVLIMLLLSVGFQPFASAQYFDCEEELFPRKDKETRLYGYVNFIGEMRVPPTFVKALPFQGKNAIVQQGKQFGVIDCKGYLVVPPAYDDIKVFFDGKGWAKKADLWALVDAKGRQLISPTYEEANDVSPRSIFTWVKKNDLWGLISKENGRFVIPQDYDVYTDMSDSAGIVRKGDRFNIVYYGDGRVIYPNLRAVKKLTEELYAFKKEDGKWGVITSLAYTLVRPEFDTLFTQQGYFIVKKGGNFGLRNLKGVELLPPNYQFIGAFSENLALVKENGKYGYVNNNGNWIVKPEFDYAEKVKDYLAIAQKGAGTGIFKLLDKTWLLPPDNRSVERNYNYPFFAVRKDKQVSLIDKQAKALLNLSFDSVILADQIETIRVKTASGWNYLNGKTFTMLSSAAWSKVKPFQLGYGMVEKDQKWGVVDAQGKEIIAPTYESIDYFIAGKMVLFQIKDNGKLGIMSPKAETILPAKFDLIADAEGNYFKVKIQEKYGLLDKKGKELLPAEYTFLSNKASNPDQPDFPMVFQKGKKTGLITANGQILFEKSTTPLRYLGNGMYAYEENNKIGLVNLQGKIIAEPIYDKVEPFWDKLAPALTGSRWGFVNAFGRYAIQPKYEDVKTTAGKICYVKENGKWGGINAQGKYLIKPMFNNWILDGEGKIKLVN